MKIITLKEYPDYKPDIEFKEPSAPRLIAAIITGTVSLFLLVITQYPLFGIHPWKPWCYVAGGILGLIALLSYITWRKSLRPTNWLLRASGNRIWIKFRSFQNDHLPTDDPQVIELDRGEIEWVQSVTVRMKYLARDPEGSGWITGHQKLRFLDIGLARAGTSALDDQLRIEEGRPKPNSGKFRNYPVTVPADGVVRLCWSDQYGRIKPNVDEAVTFFGRWTKTRAVEIQTIDYRPPALELLPQAEQRKRLRELERLTFSSATETTKRLMKCSVTEARQILQSL